MPEFTYEALGGTGQRSQGTVTANNEREALALLDARGLFPLRVEAAKPAARLNWGGRVSSRHVANLFAQLADLLRSGVPLLRSLEVLERQNSQPALSGVLREIHVKVADGTSLAEAMAQYPHVFNELSVSMVRAGQEGGFLEDVLERVAAFTEHQEDLKAKVVGALAYPVFLALTCVAVLNLLIIFAVPRFEPIFKKLEDKGDLPVLTQGLLGVSRGMQTHIIWILPALIALGFAFRRWSASPSGRPVVDSWRLRLPVIGKVYLNFALSRFTRILGTLLRNGIPILNALRIAKDSTGNRVLADAINEAAEQVTAGNKIAPPLGACKFIPRDVIEMISVGEESNQLEKVLLNIAEALEKRTSRQLELFVRLLEPVMLLVMALVILIVIAGLLLPIFKMSSTVR